MKWAMRMKMVNNQRIEHVGDEDGRYIGIQVNRLTAQHSNPSTHQKWVQFDNWTNSKHKEMRACGCTTYQIHVAQQANNKHKQFLQDKRLQQTCGTKLLGWLHRWFKKIVHLTGRAYDLICNLQIQATPKWTPTKWLTKSLTSGSSTTKTSNTMTAWRSTQILTCLKKVEHKAKRLPTRLKQGCPTRP